MRRAKDFDIPTVLNDLAKILLAISIFIVFKGDWPKVFESV